MITWKFKDGGITFKSKEENLNRDISKMSYANNIDPSTKIIIINGEPTKPIPTNATRLDGDTSSVQQPTVPVGTKKAKATKKETNELHTVFSDLDDADLDPDPLVVLDTLSGAQQFSDGSLSE